MAFICSPRAGRKTCGFLGLSGQPAWTNLLTLVQWETVSQRTRWMTPRKWHSGLHMHAHAHSQLPSPLCCEELVFSSFSFPFPLLFFIYSLVQRLGMKEEFFCNQVLRGNDRTSSEIPDRPQKSHVSWPTSAAFWCLGWHASSDLTCNPCHVKSLKNRKLWERK